MTIFKERVTRAQALLQNAQQITRDAQVSVLAELTDILSMSAPNPSANNPNGGEDVLFDELVNEMQQLQDAAAKGTQTQCWGDFMNNTSGIREFLASKHGQTLTSQDKQKVINATIGAIETYDKCMLYRRPKFRAG